MQERTTTRSGRGLDCIALVVATDEYVCRMVYTADELRAIEEIRELEAAEVAGNA